MKRTIGGSIAFNSIINAPLPEKTDTYTPISHGSIIDKIRKEVEDAGYEITEETYRSSLNGQIALGTFKLRYEFDSDIELSATFLNSYNKQYAFRFMLGATIKQTGMSFILNNSRFGYFKRVHKGEANILAEGKIKEFLQSSGEYWRLLVQYKDGLKTISIPKELFYVSLGELFFDKNTLSSIQLNIIKKEMIKPSFDYKNEDEMNGWTLFNHVALSLQESHPATWMDDMCEVTSVFNNYLEYYLSTPLPTPEKVTEDMLISYEEEFVDASSILAQLSVQQPLMDYTASARKALNLATCLLNEE